MPLMPRDGSWTVDDLADLPDDGLQYELADGVLLVTPSPRPLHQRMSMRLSAVLQQTLPDELELFAAPLDYRPTPTTSLQPDLMIVRREDVGDEAILGTPVLVIEILSPSTRAKDLVLKRALYAASGIPSYWVLDPTDAAVVLMTLEGTEYVVSLRATGDQAVRVSTPFEVTFVPDALLR